jgi:predicted transcriptional regulator
MVRVPYLPKQIAQAEQQASIMVAANHHKESDFVIKAKQARRMLDLGMSLREVATDFGVSDAAVGQWLRLLDLSASMRAAVEQGAMTPSAAVQYSDLPHEEQDRVVGEAQALGVKISTTKAREDRSKRSRGEVSKSPNVVKPIPASVVRKLLEQEEFMEGLTPSERGLICWIAGHPGMDRRVRGLRAALKEIGYLAGSED